MSGDSGLLTALCLSRSPAHILWVGLKSLRCPWYQNKGSLHCQDLRFCILGSPGLHHLADKWLTLTCQACAKHFGALSPLVLTTALVMWMLTETLFLIHYEFISGWGKELRGEAQVVKRQSKRWQHGPMLFYSSNLGFWRQSWGNGKGSHCLIWLWENDFSVCGKGGWHPQDGSQGAYLNPTGR